MMILDAVTQLGTALEALIRIMRLLQPVLKTMWPFFNVRAPRVVYETVSLTIALDIQDVQGKRAVLLRHQQVQFSVADVGVVRDLVWGDGNPLVRYSVRGGQRLAVQPEGSKRIVLIGLTPHPQRGARARVRSRRLVQDALTGDTEFLETMVERPTKRLALQVRFPRGRPPKEAYMVTSPPAGAVQRIPIQCAADGRASLTWRQSKPDAFRTYSLRWSW
jgi:hypothetical protein